MKIFSASFHVFRVYTRNFSTALPDCRVYIQKFSAALPAFRKKHGVLQRTFLYTPRFSWNEVKKQEIQAGSRECCERLAYIHPHAEYFRETGDGSLSKGRFPCLPFDALMPRKTGPPGEYAKKRRQRTVPCLLERAPAGRTTNQRSAFPAAADRCSCCYSKSVYKMTSALTRLFA